MNMQSPCQSRRGNVRRWPWFCEWVALRLAPWAVYTDIHEAHGSTWHHDDSYTVPDE